MKQTTKIANLAFRESERNKFIYINTDIWTKFKFWISDLIKSTDNKKVEYYYSMGKNK